MSLVWYPKLMLCRLRKDNIIKKRHQYTASIATACSHNPRNTECLCASDILGFVTIISWSSLPRSSDVDPNRSLYRLGHSLAHNDCVLRISTEFGALVDIDELIVPRNGSLLSYLIQRFSSPSLGALCFTHRRLIFSPPLTDKYSTYKDLDFSGILTAKESKRNGPFKFKNKKD
ncbi:hypothetical protein TELCIR_03771 [Teladorsagia circumcincta]|uniref:Glycosyltransferase family 92 protein n=1 Tax=Teladorsagia circumcincta TaxID=45464 RepID=A0A2G9UVF8_TELCI|nr:hypothetical protein TELCIR_03771 [Teladorsagia circumcincta]